MCGKQTGNSRTEPSWRYWYYHRSSGTGKTHPTVALTKVLVALGHKDLLCAPSNDSTDHLAVAVYRKYPELDTIRVYRPGAKEQQLKNWQSSQAEDNELVARAMDVASTLAQIKGDKRSRMPHKELSLMAHCVDRTRKINSGTYLPPIRGSEPKPLLT
ncbi:hypothetical protein FGG08_005040 [Glutinoglossum americanum]|uniref:DNA2/NAM7 helicase helicase domain-containing protein n=1 Tax=Glutinoglossum americanum TaxID=1670608 RepID=A0A9P8IA71_9PEZI|nr:hypothetical protein FGG08_005040 [Glutinoglossum americanum]